MKKLILVSLLTVCLVTSARASMFKSGKRAEHIRYLCLSAEINSYVTGVHASSVRALNAELKDHPGWLIGNGRYKQYLKSQALLDGDMGLDHGFGLNDEDALKGDDSLCDVDIPDSSLPIDSDGCDTIPDDSIDTGSSVVPVPGAVLLGMLGLSIVGVKLRKYA